MKQKMDTHWVFVLMGVSGCGKSVVGRALAARWKCAFLDGDFLHPRNNILKMAAGQSLDDDDRRPWLQAVNNAIFAMQHTQTLSLVVCSALKKSYRDQLREGNDHLRFLHLHGDAELIEQRLQERKGHFFKPQMLKSQFATLEMPDEDEYDVWKVDIQSSLRDVVDEASRLIDWLITDIDIDIDI